VNYPVLTTDGREQLGQRLTRLREEVLPELLEAFRDRHRDGEAVIEYERVLIEAHRLEVLLASAGRLEDRPDDPAVVELGDLVTLELAGGDIERFLIVDPLEAALDELRISADSPLARAVLGLRVGDEAEVNGPASRYTCRVLGATRPVASQPSAP